MEPTGLPPYRADLALVHHRGFTDYTDRCAPEILELLQPVRRRGGLVLELGCGSGTLTRHLVDAGHRVIATDASPAMLDLARVEVPDAEAIRVLVLPHHPLPGADAIVSVGHVLSYLPDEEAIARALVNMAAALQPGGVLAVDLCDLRWGQTRSGAPTTARVEEDWALFTAYAVSSPTRFERRITTFVRRHDGAWRRDDERHVNVLLDPAPVPDLLASQGVDAEVRASFGSSPLPEGLVAVVGRRHARPGQTRAGAG